MAPITLQRLVKELDKLKPEPDAARLKSHDYARRLARMIRQLRERGLDADRAAATAALAEALKRATECVERSAVDSFIQLRQRTNPRGLGCLSAANSLPCMRSDLLESVQEVAGGEFRS